MSATTDPVAVAVAADPTAATLVKLADDELAVGHVLTSVAGWGPELEVNLALSSIGQDELGHARLLYVLAVGDDRDRVNACAYGRDSGDMAACALAATYTEDWQDLVVKQFLYDTADAERVRLLADATRADVRAVTDRVAAEERYHVDFWTGWLRRTAAAGTSARRRLQDALDRIWPLTGGLFALPEGATALGLPADRVAAAHDSWAAAVRARLADAGLVIPAETEPSATRPAARGDLERIVEEMRYVHQEAPGRW